LAFLIPAFLLLGLLAAPIVLMYMLRLRRREIVVSSTLLWQKLLRDREANAPWQRLRRHLLLFLQLLILAALVLALARPFLPTPMVTSGSTVILLDGSASMQATDVEPSRFVAATHEVAALIRNLGSGNQMTLILVKQTPLVLASASSDQNHLLRSLAEAEPGIAPANWPAAFALAAGAAQGFRDARIVIVSDGGLPADLPALPAEVVFVPVGRSGENLAISALATRSGETNGDGPQLFAAVSNNGRSTQHALLSLYLDGRFFDSRRLQIAPGDVAHFTWTLPETPAVIEARLGDTTADYLALDNVAWAVHEGGVTNRVLLVSSGNLFLERIFSVLPGVNLFRERTVADGAAEDSGAAFSSGYDLYVFDGTPLPDPLPVAPILIINPQAENELLRVTGVFSDTQLTRLADSPLLRYLEWGDVNIRQAQAVTAPWAQTLIGASGGPLLLAGEYGGQRVAILTFDLHNSDLPLRIAFPILMANITDWLNPARAFDTAGSLQPGDAVSIRPGATTTAVTVTKPDGTTWRAAVGEEALLFTETDQLGLYRVTLNEAGGPRDGGAFAINLFAPVEASIEPATAVTIGHNPVTTAGRDAVGQQELWPWLALLAVVILVAEWWVYHRGTPRADGSWWSAGRRWLKESWPPWRLFLARGRK
jgi:Ca-activated chloride channel homolog